MKKLIRLFTVVLLSACTHTMAQTTDVKVCVKGIKEAKGKVLVAIVTSDEPAKTFTGFAEVTDINDVSCIIKDVPTNKKITISAFQDMNDDFKLNLNENNIPIEPCNKQETKIKEGQTNLNIKLLNILSMMSNQN
ncbi:MAG: DUF2141 domain-containing protein [Phocaeicola sp.]|uniref:DUF2141 domain-containing protein n=1 Tax=Phocaeicola TaxID=909656 RepID=UPI00234F2D5B|nr:DUF2141 domain-containing protein [Phocaeicola oris]MCE2615908.1 DUF2141 domain-containing protein [Phocaeicola oris]